MSDWFSAAAFSFGVGLGVGTMAAAFVAVACAELLKRLRAASGMSAGTAETQSGSGRKPASPTAAPSGGDAPTTSERESGD